MNPLLTTTGLTKRYGKVTVLDQVDMDVRSGEIHALLGANGAGKSTLCKILSGLITRSDGTINFDGHEYLPANKQDAESCGIEIVQQELNLIPTLSVAENLMLTRMPTIGGVIRQREMHGQARQLLDQFGLETVDTHALVESLGVGRQQMVEIAASLGRDCKLLILDEPTAALSVNEAEYLFGWLDKLRRQGVGIIYISHRLDEVSTISDRVTVLRDGKHVCTRQTSELSTEDMVDLMSGEEAHSHVMTDHRSFSTGEMAMRVDGLSRGLVDDVSFTVHRGERLGIAGLVGSGRTELLRVIFGADLATSGNLFLGDESEPRRFRSPHEAVAAGLAMVTEDRKRNGLLLPQSVRVNTTLSSMQKRFSAGGLIRGDAEEAAALQMCQSMETRCTSIEQSVGTLSGGNQQKVAVAKWLVRDAEVFLFDEPTRGIDISARRRIYRLFDTLAQDGTGLVIVSSDLEELLENCDRIAVMSAGRLVACFDRRNWSHETIMQASFEGYLAN